MDTSPPSKKVKLIDDCSDLDRRKQVDAHVQAFLKAVLDHAQGALGKRINSKDQMKEKKDAFTQTDEFSDHESSTYIPEYDFATGTINESGVHSEAVNTNSSDFTQSQNTQLRVPNREMYSQEALSLFSQPGLYSSLAQEELFSANYETTHYFSGNQEAHLPDNSEITNGNRVSSSKIRRAINQWVKKYEDWFFQNFGMDVRTVQYTAQPNTQNTCVADVATNFASLHPQTDTSVSLPQLQSSVVISHSPVSYFVPEGSLCTLDARFSPYYSLIPSFYSPPAVGNSTQFYMHPAMTPLHFITNPALIQTAQTFVPPTCLKNTFSPQLSVPTISNIPLFGSPQPPIVSSVPNTPSGPPTNKTAVNSPQASFLSGKTSFADLPAELQTSALLATLAVPMQDCQGNLGQWGPQLKYGTYGRLPSKPELDLMNAQKKTYQCSSSNSFEVSTSSDKSIKASASNELQKMPPPPPTFLLLRRQAMICALQLSCRERGRELFLREKEGSSGLLVDYISELEQIVDSNTNLQPTYLFTHLATLPTKEMMFYMNKKRFHLSTRIDIENCEISGPSTLESSPENQHSFLKHHDLIACDLLIGDVLIAESLATFKSQAKMCAARQAFHILSQPCFLVGSKRQWDEVEYLVLCLSPKAEMVPILPPFLKDPFECLVDQNDSSNSLNDKNVNIIMNPKPTDDMWIYMANLPFEYLDDQKYTTQILAQSAAFSQMNISFEVEVKTSTGQFVCNILVDNQRCMSAESPIVSEAYQVAATKFLNWLRATQPIVGLLSIWEEIQSSQQVLPLWGVPEYILVENLMWGKGEREMAIHLEQLEAHCEIPPTPSSESNDIQPDENDFTSPELLANYLEAYASSALVTPLCVHAHIVPPSLWHIVQQCCRRWGLLSCVQEKDSSDYLLVCKRVPLPRLKRTLYDDHQYGCFRLIQKGNLSCESVKRLSSAEPLSVVSPDVSTTSFVYTPDVNVHNLSNSPDRLSEFNRDDTFSDEPVTRLARKFYASARHSHVKNEPEVDNPSRNVNDDCVLLTAELNHPSNAIEILDDLPKTLIPGIDF